MDEKLCENGICSSEVQFQVHKVHKVWILTLNVSVNLVDICHTFEGTIFETIGIGGGFPQK